MSTSAPDYYAKLEKLSYTWFMNNTEMGKGNNQMLSLYITKDLRYNKYSCTAMGKKLESDQSDTVQINPLCKIMFAHKTCLIRHALGDIFGVGLGRMSG